ncbi:MAG: hypothetical protein IPO83_18650 [Chitinophagaceae bacterium]|nr:hypothetical protein [Chitinophagaceae bacterium]
MTNTFYKMNIYLSLYALICITACNGQNTAKITDDPASIPVVTGSIGETVSELDKSIWIVFQDTNNNYWFGSDGQGVYRYDGKTIIHFSSKDGLCNNRVREILEDPSGNIFIGTLDGISKFDGQKFTTLIPIESTEWKSAPTDLWFKGNYDQNGPYRYDGKLLYHFKFPKHYMEDEFYKVNPKSSFSPYGIYTIYKDKRGNIWFGTSCFGACRFDGKTLSWLYEDHLTIAPNGGSFGIRSIIEDKEEKFWICNTRYRYEIYPTDSISEGYSFVNYQGKPVLKHMVKKTRFISSISSRTINETCG